MLSRVSCRTILFLILVFVLTIQCSDSNQPKISSQQASANGVPASPNLGWLPLYASPNFAPPSPVIPSGVTGSVLDFGAKCDGATDDRVAIQQALDALVVVQFPSGATCVVNANGLPFFFYKILHRYALSVPSNRTLLLSGSTLKLGDGQNAHLFINANAAGTGDHDIAILGPGTLDLNKANQTSPPTGEQSGGFMDQVVGLTVRDVTFTHVREYALRHFRVTRGFYDNLICTDSDGSCFAFGVSDVGGPSDSYFGHLEGHNAAGFASPGAIGNPFIAHGSNNILVSFIGTGNHYGFKLQDGAADWVIGRIQVTGTYADKGVKLMGTAGAVQTRRVTIGEVVTSGSYYEGFYVWESDDIEVRRVVSIGDATGAASPAVTFASTVDRMAIRSISAEKAKAGGVSLEGSDIEIGEIYARNNGWQVGGQENVAIHKGGQRIRIGSVITADDRQPRTVWYGLGIHRGAHDLDVQSFLPLGSFLGGPWRNEGTNVRIVNYQTAVRTFLSGDTTPSVQDGVLFKTENVEPTTISNFKDGRSDQEISVLCGDSKTTLLNGGNLRLAAPLTCRPGNVIRFMFDGTAWLETGRTAV